MKMKTIREAYPLVLKKWTFLSKNNFMFVQDAERAVLQEYPELGSFTANCAYCALFLRKDCIGCPLAKYGLRCMDRLSVYDLWGGSAESALMVLELIIETYPFKNETDK